MDAFCFQAVKSVLQADQHQILTSVEFFRVVPGIRVNINRSNSSFHSASTQQPDCRSIVHKRKKSDSCCVSLPSPYVTLHEISRGYRGWVDRHFFRWRKHFQTESLLSQGWRMTRRVAVIGGGSSGLVCIKCCLDEGLEPICFESSDDIGGLWRFKVGSQTHSMQVIWKMSKKAKMNMFTHPICLSLQENPESDRASIYHSVIINTSKEMMCFSDYPIPAHFPNYMHNSLIMDYFRMYADHFQLIKYIRFNVRRLISRLWLRFSPQLQTLLSSADLCTGVIKQRVLSFCLFVP